ncbi:LacI family DNA-binding transcriptional regulator [Paenibacillus terreus]|uniref:LacI family DNA-binding transcriptional regulator n=2 Tax=Paenibacillus terreus TaxID=1387834 RepID=A0ABV5B6M6_9BACL
MHKGLMNIVRRIEVAELAGVSEATVSRVLNGVGPIKEETRQRVLEAAERLGYTPNAMARSLARRRSGNLGVVMPYLPKARLFSAHYFSEILSGIGSRAREEGYDLLIIFRDPDGATDVEGLFRMQKIDACLILGAKEEAEERETLRRMQEKGYPFCLINQHFAGESFNEVDADHTEGSYQAVRHLLEQGFRRIAFVNGPEVYSNSSDRRAGYERALQEAGLPIESDLLFAGNFSRTSGLRVAEEILGDLNRIDSIFAANDRMAIGIQQGLRQAGVLPEHMPAIVGYDDSDAAEMTSPGLSSVRVPFYELGEMAAARVLRLLEEPEKNEETPPFKVRLPVELVVRASSVKNN